MTKGKANGMTEKKRLLVVRFSALGDVAMTIPVVYSLARQYPGLQIDFVTNPFFARLFINAPENLTVHPLDIRKEYKGAGGLLRLLRAVDRLRPDMVADLHNVSRSWAIDNWMRLRGRRVEMVDKMRSGRRDVIKNKTVQPTFFSRYADVFARLGYPVKLDFDTIFGSGLTDVSIEIPENAVGIAPFARYANKTYPLTQVEEVVNNLDKRGIPVFLFGGRGEEAEKLRDLALRYNSARSIAGELPIEEELAVMAHMKVMVSMDSANHHLASLAGTPVVSIWGSTTPACGFTGYRQNPADSLCLDLPCQPCTIAGSPTCPRGHLDCMTKLTPAAVTDKILSHIRS